MKIHFKNINNVNVAIALVEIPDQVLNHFAVKTEGEDHYLDIPHVRNNTFTRIMGDAALSFQENLGLRLENNELVSIQGQNIKSIEGIGVEKINPIKALSEQGSVYFLRKEEILKKLGFQKRTSAKWWNPIFGEDQEQNWMDFEVNVDELSSIIPKLFRSGYAKGQRKVRFDIKTALDISLI